MYAQIYKTSFIMKTMRNNTAIHVTNKKNSIVKRYNLHGLTSQLEETSKYNVPISQVLN